MFLHILLTTYLMVLAVSCSVKWQD